MTNLRVSAGEPAARAQARVLPSSGHLGQIKRTNAPEFTHSRAVDHWNRGFDLLLVFFLFVIILIVIISNPWKRVALQLRADAPRIFIPALWLLFFFFRQTRTRHSPTRAGSSTCPVSCGCSGTTRCWCSHPAVTFPLCPPPVTERERANTDAASEWLTDCDWRRAPFTGGASLLPPARAGEKEPRYDASMLLLKGGREEGMERRMDGEREGGRDGAPWKQSSNSSNISLNRLNRNRDSD